MIELLHENDLDDGDELPGLNNDEIADRDELVEGVSQATSENVFESLCATNNAEAIKEDIFNDFGSSSDSDDEKPETQAENSEKKESTQKVEEDDDLEKIEEKMDTSSPWPDATGETAPVTTTFNAWVTPAESENANQGDTGWASFDQADFGPQSVQAHPVVAMLKWRQTTLPQKVKETA